MVYPTLLAAVSDVAHPHWRGSAVGVYRLFGMAWAIGAVALLTFGSGLAVAVRMPETLDRLQRYRG